MICSIGIGLLIDKIDWHVNLLKEQVDKDTKIIVVLDRLGAVEELMKGERRNVGELLYKMRNLRAFVILVKEESLVDNSSQTEYLTDVIIELK